MSIRTNRMKAVPLLLKHVRSARRTFRETGRDEPFEAKLEKVMQELNKIKDVFMGVSENEDELLDVLVELDGHLRRLDKKKLDEKMDDICERISDSASKLLPEKKDDKSTEKVHSYDDDPSSSQQHKKEVEAQDLNLLWQSYRKLGSTAKECLPSLSVFPEDAVIKKRQAIYWWIGEGLVRETSQKTAEEVGEDVINQLLKCNVIVPHGNGKCPVVNKFKVHHHFRRELESSLMRENQRHLGFYLRILFYPTWLVLNRRKVVLGDDDEVGLKTERLIHTVFNVGASYLDFRSQWSDKLENDLVVLQLGRWQDSPSHHIEVGSEEFLDELRNLKQLKYLCLCGISRISKLPPSIFQLESLQVLDLKACHNLETLPDDIASMKSLTHLILSQCYFLEGMPKGIEKLTQLQVLKGFVIGSSSKISDLANLKHLRRLSIHIGSEAVIGDPNFEGLGVLSALEHLKISWGVSDTMYNKIILPSRLKKLHLEGFPGQKIPEWLKPTKLPMGFKVLYITGGKLKSMNHDENMGKWCMEIVRLKYLKDLKVDLTNLQELFPLLRYAEMKQISKSNPSNIAWSID